jgi:hypothetical protein
MTRFSRRSMLGVMLTGIPSFLGYNSAEAQTADEADQLRHNVIAMAEHTGGDTELVRDWLDHSVTAHSHPGNGFHDQFANRYHLQSEDPLQYSTEFDVESQTGKAGVDGHPWMGTENSGKYAQLNLAEMESLLPASQFYGGQVQLYTGGAVIPVACPFPIGPRRPPLINDYPAFGQLLLSSGYNPNFLDFCMFDISPWRFGMSHFGRHFPPMS